MKDENHKSHSNGFAWGLVIGASLAALVGTKKGRAFLKELSGSGMEILEDFLEEKNIDFHDFVKEEEEVASPVSEEEEETEDSLKDKPQTSVKKRLFKGVKK